MISWRNIFVCFSVLSTYGCATTQPVAQVVKIPVRVECVKNVPDRPELTSTQLPQTATAFEVHKSIIYDLLTSQQHINDLEAVIEGCK